jgi:ABC-type sugar transport system permease subunit
VIHILVLFLVFGSFLPNEISCSRTFFTIHRILLSLIFLLFFTSFSLILNYFFNLILNNEKIVKIFNLIFLILNFILYFSIIIFLIIIFIFKDDDNLFKLLTQILGLFVGCKPQDNSKFSILFLIGGGICSNMVFYEKEIVRFHLLQ